jgi:hypothetical protein
MRRKKKIQDESLPKCENCGNHDATTTERLDPYSYEIDEEEVEVFWCDECTHERAEEI